MATVAMINILIDHQMPMKSADIDLEKLNELSLPVLTELVHFSSKVGNWLAGLDNSGIPQSEKALKVHKT